MSIKKRRPRSLAGTHLYLDTRTDIYIWRRTDRISGKRIKRSTGTKNLEIARRKAVQFEEDFERQQAGLKTYDCWRKELAPMAEEWLASLKCRLAETTLRTRSTHIRRALDELELRVAADLDDVAKIHDRLLALGKLGKTRNTLRRCYQHPLKQFSAWLAGNKRHLDRDPLYSWVAVPTDKDEQREVRRAFLPEEVARALFALDQLDAMHARSHSQRLIFTTFLIAAPRMSALLSRNVEHFHEEARRIDFGAGSGNKRVGAGALDAATSTEIAFYLGSRSEGPLFLTARAFRPNKERLLDYWREAFGLGIVDVIWPAGEAKDLPMAHLVNRALISGRVRVSMGGNPLHMKPSTIGRRAELARRVGRLADRLREEWQGRMSGIDVHAFRKTHRSWAEAQGVPPILIDKQLGHGGVQDRAAGDLARLIHGSKTGRKHYLDLNSRLFDASRSAEAVRELLETAIAEVSRDGSSVVARILAHTKKKTGT